MHFGWNMLDALWRDGKHALRRLAKDWQFSAGAIAILGLGIGANTAVFSLLNNSLLQPHPFTDGKRLVNVYQNDATTGEPEGVSYPAFLHLRQETALFAGVAAAQMDGGRYQTVDAQGRRSVLRSAVVEYVSANYLEVIGMRPSLGRWFDADEERRAEPVAVLGWSAWQRHFDADSGVIGKTLIVGGTSFQIVGVGPAALNSTQSNFVVTALWMPISRMEPPRVVKPAGTPRLLENRRNLFLQVRARLRPGVTIQQAQAAMDVTGGRLAADYPDTDPGRGITVLASDDVHVHPREKFLKPIVIVVLTVVGLVLAIACSNLATLLLVRSAARVKEISVRLALGATRRQLIRHQLMESLVLSLAGSVVGIAIAGGALGYLATVDLPLVLSMRLDPRVLGFAVAVAALCAVGFGLAPALQATRLDFAGALRQEKGSSASSLSLTRGWFTLKNVLVVGQVAGSFLLLVGAALAMSVLSSTQNRSVGYRADGLAIIQTDPTYAGYDLPRALAVFRDLQDRISVLPGVDSVFVTTGSPVDAESDQEILLEDANEDESFKVETRSAGPGYFQTLGIPVLFGRVFEERDSPDSPEVVVVSEAFARRFFRTSNAVGNRLRFAETNTRQLEIVGVVGDVRSIDFIGDAPQPLLYRSASQTGKIPTTIVARTSRNEADLAGVVQHELRRLRPELPVTSAITMKQRQAMELMPFRIAVISLGTLGSLGLVLAAVGLYAVVSYSVAQRTNELGIRSALGARAGHLTWLVVRDVTALVATAVATGAALAWTGVALLQSSVARIVGVDALALVPVAVVIVACGAVAAFVPARRAVRIDPIAAIRRQ